ncbi:hypothetical protein PENTCL1PPCAC_14343, partial [Pristionchus entomophagus]
MFNARSNSLIAELDVVVFDAGDVVVDGAGIIRIIKYKLCYQQPVYQCTDNIVCNKNRLVALVSGKWTIPLKNVRSRACVSRVLELLRHFNRAVDKALEVVFADVAHAGEVFLGDFDVLAGVRLDGVSGSVVDSHHYVNAVHLHESVGVHARRGHQTTQTCLQGALKAAIHVVAHHTILLHDRSRLLHVIDELGQSLGGIESIGGEVGVETTLGFLLFIRRAGAGVVGLDLERLGEKVAGLEREAGRSNSEKAEGDKKSNP